jgi:hypothetical protein|mmetsp:Transcript_7005/g.11293  ORF Transcript_7005/g.11293 Transcript_7005/m.11293 type:complete len:297 (-) Transcript_7005:102-992(-)
MSFMVRHRLSLLANTASIVILIVCSVVSASIQECAESGVCPASLPKVRPDPRAEIAPENFDAEVEEEANDADYSVHMQMRLTVDLPTEEDKEPHFHSASLSSFGAETHGVARGNHHASGASSHGDNDVLAMLSGPATVHKPPSEPVMPVAAPTSGTNLLLGIVICALLLVVGILVGTLIWSLRKERQAKDQAELKAAAKAWMLDWALGFEPDKELDMNEDAFSKVQLAKKKAPPVPNEYASSDTDEEEPEAESDAEPAFELEEVVFQAAQVEVANEAMDNEYGSIREVRLADQIIP